jgi:alpha-tubulin suppressor-like RCC1 family protein
LGINSNVDSNVIQQIKFFADKKIIDISSGCSHSLAYSDDGNFYAFGKNNFNQLGCDDNFDHYLPIKIFETKK